MRAVWKKSMATVASIAIGVAAGVGCGSEEKVENKQASQDVKSTEAKPGPKRVIDAPWIKPSLEGIQLTRAQAKKIRKISTERERSIETRSEIREAMERISNAENQEALSQLSGAVEDPDELTWLTKVRAVLTREQADKFDANNED